MQGRGSKRQYKPSSNQDGVADILGNYHGVPVAIEVKTDKGKQRPNQLAWQLKWELLNGLYIIARSWEDVAEALLKL